MYARASFEYCESGGSAGINVAEDGCAGDRCRDGPHLDFSATRIFRHVKQKLTAAQINGSSPYFDGKDSLIADTQGRCMLTSQLTTGLDAGLDRRALANVVVYRSR